MRSSSMVQQWIWKNKAKDVMKNFDFATVANRLRIVSRSDRSQTNSMINHFTGAYLPTSHNNLQVDIKLWNIDTLWLLSAEGPW